MVKPDDPNRRPKPKWLSLPMEDEVHVTPEGEGHELSASCWCEPERSQQPNCLPVYSHRTALQVALSRPVPDYCPGLLT